MTIMAGGSRSNARYFNWHLQRTDGGQTVEIRDVVGLMGDTMRGWFDQIEAMALGGNTTNTFYHFNLNPREGEAFTPEQEKIAVATALKNLGLEDQPYFVVKHGGKDGRPDHYHCVALRVDLDTGKAISDSNNYATHMRTADELEKLFAHERTERGRGPDGPNPKNYEVQRGLETGIDPVDVGDLFKQLWRTADTGKALAAAIEDQGFVLANGTRGYVALDAAGDVHSLAKRFGVKMRDVEARMKDVPLDSLPSVEEARALARQRAAERQEREETPPEPSALPADPSQEKRERAVLGELAVELASAIEDAITPKEPPAELPPVAAEAVRPEATVFDTFAENLAKGATEAGPVAAELVAAAAVMEAGHVAENILQAKSEPAPEPVTAPTPSPPQEPPMDAVERMARDMMAAMREPPPVRLSANPDDWDAQMVRAMYSNGGSDGLNFWQRSAAALAVMRDRVAAWAKDTWADLVGRFTRGPNTGPDTPDSPGFER